MAEHNRHLDGLDKTKELFELCKKYKVKKFKKENFEFEFSDLAFYEPLDENTIRDAVEKYRKTANQEDKEFERTLYHSS